MKNKTVKKRIVLIILSFLLLVSVSYAWFFEERLINGYRILDFDFSNTGIFNSRVLECKIYISDGNGWKSVESAEDILAGNIAPNETVPFRIRLYNYSDENITANLSFAGTRLFFSDDYLDYISAKNSGDKAACNAELRSISDEMMNSMFFGFRNVGGVYVTKDVKLPDNEYICFSDASFRDDSYFLKIFDSVTIPPTLRATEAEKARGIEDEYAELQCYLYFSGNNASSRLMDVEFSLGQLRMYY